MFNSKNRKDIIKRLNDSSFDLLVIGGGITGAGIALDASARGLKVALIEMQDFASGTSGRSTKLIHGGLRYLKQLEFKLVSEVGKEREIVHRNAPHLTKPEKMLLPIVRGGSLGKFSARVGMFIYEWLAGVKKEEQHKILNLEETISAEPLLKKENLLAGILFYEYRTDDARLTIEVMKEAVSRGTTAVNYMKAISFLYEGDKIVGAEIQDQLNETLHKIKAKYIVNACGPFVDELDDLDKKHSAHKLHITKGVHLVVDFKKLPVKQSVYFDTHDKRMIFVIPREGKTYIGTTDTFYEGDLKNPTVTQNDKTYLLKCVNEYFPKNNLTDKNIESCWAGLRPLVNKPGKGPSEISRKDEVFISESGLITIAGGKLTGYRKMGERVTNIVAKKIKTAEGKNIPDCTTDTVQLSGGKINEKFSEFIKNKIPTGINLGLTNEETEKLIYHYGSNIDEIFSCIEQLTKNASATNEELPVILRAQLIYAVEKEMCVTTSDFFIRRTGALYFDIESVRKWKEPLSRYMKNLMGWNENSAKRFDDDLKKSLERTQV